jgi:dephospho-CoA kinase
VYVLALTGGIGAGKTTAAGFFRERGAEVISLDEVARGLLEPGTAVYREVVAEFGAAVLVAHGSIDTAALAREAFASPSRAQRLNSIVHPAAFEQVSSMLEQMRGQSDPPRLVVLDIPLLAEYPHFADLSDAVLVVSAPVEARVARAVASGMAEADVRARAACQASDTEREALADYAIHNDGTLEAYMAALSRFVSEVLADEP